MRELEQEIEEGRQRKMQMQLMEFDSVHYELEQRITVSRLPFIHQSSRLMKHNISLTVFL